MGGKREGLAQFANLPFLARFLSFQKQYILNIYNDILVKLIKYICWQVQVRVTLCDSFYTSIRIKLQDTTKLANFARPSPAVQIDPVTREGLILGHCTRWSLSLSWCCLGVILLLLRCNTLYSSLRADPFLDRSIRINADCVHPPKDECSQCFRGKYRLCSLCHWRGGQYAII